MRTLLYIIRHPRTFAQGFREAHTTDGVTFDNDPSAPRSVAYDAGRAVRKGATTT